MKKEQKSDTSFQTQSTSKALKEALQNITLPPNMVRIPKIGNTVSFWMGRPDSDHWGYDDERPYHSVTLRAYLIDIYPVTAKEYKTCVNAGACTKPDHYSHHCTYNVSGKENHPINCITWFQAQIYCAWKN